MKLKIVLLTMTLALAGCHQNFDRPAASIAHTGDLKFIGGTGLVYKRAPSVCGHNCDYYANAKAEDHRVELPGLEESATKSYIAERRSALARKCQIQIDSYLNGLEQKFVLLNQNAKFSEAQAIKAKYDKIESKYYVYINKCTEDNLYESN